LAFIAVYCAPPPRGVLSFPTRRSSDLDAVAASSGLLLAFGIGAMIGPGFASIWMDLGGPYALFLYFAVWSAGLVVFVLHRQRRRDRKSTRLNSSHVKISYAVFCLKKKK